MDYIRLMIILPEHLATSPVIQQQMQLYILVILVQTSKTNKPIIRELSGRLYFHEIHFPMFYTSPSTHQPLLMLLCHRCSNVFLGLFTLIASFPQKKTVKSPFLQVNTYLTEAFVIFNLSVKNVSTCSCIPNGYVLVSLPASVFQGCWMNEK